MASIKSRIAVTSRAFIVSGSLLLLLACDNKESQEESKGQKLTLESPAEPIEKQGKEPTQVKQAVEKREAKQYKQSKLTDNMLLPFNSLPAAQGKLVEKLALDLSLNLDIVEYKLESDRQQLFQGLFESAESDFDIEMETRFEWPHNENKERDLTPNGAGVTIKVGI